MRILLTRAKDDAERTAARLATLGHQSVISPVIEIVPLAASVPHENFDAVIATSTHAFAGANLRKLVHLPLYAVGARTREMAEGAGWLAAIHVSENANALIARLGARMRFKRILYLAGHDRKPDIELAANGMGAALDVVETYAARETSALTEEAGDALRKAEIDGVLHYSRRSAEIFITLAMRADVWTNAEQLQHFVLSSDAGEPLASAGVQPYVARRPDEDHLLALLARAGAQ